MKIQAVQLETAAMTAVRAFYHARLDLDFHALEQGTCAFGTGASRLIFAENPGASGVYHFAFNIPCNQIEAAKKWLTRRKVPLIRGVQGEEIIQFPNWHARSVYFFDPAGNIVEFIARDDLRNDSNRAFGPESLLEISEIGIVARDVDTWRTVAEARYDVDVFDKQAPAANFAVLGNDHGLFIVVAERRPWFLTDIPATINPLVVWFENERGQKFQLSVPG